jgi:hypothetical protein
MVTHVGWQPWAIMCHLKLVHATVHARGVFAPVEGGDMLYHGRLTATKSFLPPCWFGFCKGREVLKTEAQAIFHHWFTVCSSCQLKFVSCSLFDEKTNGSYPFTNGLNGLAHLCPWVNGYTCGLCDITMAWVTSCESNVHLVHGLVD